MDAVASKLGCRPQPLTRRLRRVSVFFGEKNGKYPDGNQVHQQSSDTRAALDALLVPTTYWT